MGAGSTDYAPVDCPAGQVTGGGYYTTSDVAVHQSYPADADTWLVSAKSSSPVTRDLVVYAICMTIEPAGALTVASRKSVKAAQLTKSQLRKLRRRDR